LDLEVLINIIQEENIELIPNIECLISLEEYAVEGRYAILQDDIEDTNKYIQILEKLLKFVNNTISKKI